MDRPTEYGSPRDALKTSNKYTRARNLREKFSAVSPNAEPGVSLDITGYTFVGTETRGREFRAHRDATSGA